MDILTSFSQEKEDIVLWHILKKVGGKDIRWVDVGANDPVFMSVTKFFSCMGAKGVNIEPQKVFFDKLVEDRPNDINIRAGIGDVPGELTLYGDGAGASFDCELDVQSKEKTQKVEIRTLKQIFRDYSGDGIQVHILKIDVEGWETKCLQGMDFVAYRPWIICIESCIPSTDIPCYEQWEHILLDNEYILWGAEKINRYYAAKERIGELNPFVSAEELSKQYEIIDYCGYKRMRKLLGSRALAPFKAIKRFIVNVRKH